MDEGRCQCPTDQYHAAMDMDRRQRPLTAGTDQSVTMDMDHRHRRGTAMEQSHAVCRQDRLTADTNMGPSVTTDMDHRQRRLTARTDTYQSVAMDHRLVTDAPLGRHHAR